MRPEWTVSVRVGNSLGSQSKVFTAKFNSGGKNRGGWKCYTLGVFEKNGEMAISNFSKMAEDHPSGAYQVLSCIEDFLGERLVISKQKTAEEMDI